MRFSQYASSNEEEGSTIYGHLEYNDNDDGKAFGRALLALGQGIAKAGQYLWDHREVIGGALLAYNSPTSSTYSPSAFVQDDYVAQHVWGNPKNSQILDKVELGEPLSWNEVRQMLNAGELLHHRASTPADRAAAQTFQNHALKALVGNQLMHAPKTENGIQYEGHTLPAKHAPEMIEANLQHWYHKARPMPKYVFDNWPVTPLPMPSPITAPENEEARPIPLNNKYQRRDYPQVNRGGEVSMQKNLSLLPAGERRQEMAKHIIQAYNLNNGHKLDWYEFTDIVDYVARNTGNDEDFRQDMWALFGNDSPNLLKYIDPKNIGLPNQYKNVDLQGNPIYYKSSNPKQPLNPGEQVHHYLAGVTGDSGKNRPFTLPSNLLNAIEIFNYAPFADLNEKIEEKEKYIYNQGDINLFKIARIHYHEFNRTNGRFTVAANIRKMLIPQK